MTRTRRARAGAACRLVALSLTTAVAVACARPAAAPARAARPPAAVATTSIVADLVRQVGGDAVAVEALMGAGVDPHLYKPSAGDVRRMAAAEVIFYSGLHLEGKMAELFAEMGRRGIATRAVADCIPADQLIGVAGFDDIHDPHVWFDVALWQRTVECVRAELVARRPTAAAAVDARAPAYLAELAELDAWVRARVATLPPDRRVLVTAHDAFSYFGRAYGFEVRGLLGVSTAAEAGAADVQALADFVVARGVPAVFVETSVSPRFVAALAEAVRARGVALTTGGSLYSDALGAPDTPAATYVGTVRANVDAIVTGLGGSGG